MWLHLRTHAVGLGMGEAFLHFNSSRRRGERKLALTDFDATLRLESRPLWTYLATCVEIGIPILRAAWSMRLS